MSLYNRKEWIEFRDNVIEADGFACTSCSRKMGEVVLQVHHKVYRKGQLPWEYGISDCETLCKRCHAAEHGIIQPKKGWEFVCEEDLGDLVGECENSGCGNSIRYAFIISHPNWKSLQVGTVCCDYLTDSDTASNTREAQSRYKSRRKRFINSTRWKKARSTYRIRQSLFDIEIEKRNDAFYLTIHNLKSKKRYDTIEDAMYRAFDVIDSGDLYDYLDRKKISYRKKAS